MRDYKKKILLATMVSACLVMWGCNDDSKGGSDETTSSIIQEDESSTEQVTEVETEEPETEEKVEEPVVKKEVFNNGGSVVKYGEDTYYWQFNAESYASQGVLGDFSYNATVKNDLICKTPDGEQKTVIQVEAKGDIYIANDKLYFLRYVSEYNTEICAISQNNGEWDASSLEVICKGKIYEIDAEKEIFIIRREDENAYKTAIYNFVSGQITDINIEGESGVSYVDYSNGNIYFQATAKDWENAVLGEVAIYVADLTGASRLLVRTTPDLYEYDDGGQCEVQCIQEYDGYVYYTYGSYAGSAHYYQGGNVCRVKLDGTGNEVLGTNAAQKLYVYGQDGKPVVVFALAYDDMMSIPVKTVDVETKTVAQSDMKLGELGEVFYGFGNGCWIYENTDGVCKDLVSSADYDIDDSLDIDVEDVELVDGYVYYSVVYSRYNPEVSDGWRDGYDRVETVVYVKELATGTITKLYKY